MKKTILAVLAAPLLFTNCIGLTELNSQRMYQNSHSTLPTTHTTITAHSGAYGTPDNSLRYIETALRNNVEILEFDVNIRPNGTLVMYHDQVPNDLTGYEVDRALEMIRGTRTKVNLDIKNTAVLASLRQMVLRHGMINQVFLTGIRENDVMIVRQRFPEVKYYLNCDLDPKRYYDSRYLNEILMMLRRTGAVGINCHYSMANQTLSNWLHRNGYKLSVWTPNKRSQIRDAAGYYPDNITTRHPNRANKRVKR